MVEYLSDEDAFAELLARKSDKELLREQKRCEEELQKAMTRNDTVSRLYEKQRHERSVMSGLCSCPINMRWSEWR